VTHTKPSTQSYILRSSIHLRVQSSTVQPVRGRPDSEKLPIESIALQEWSDATIIFRFMIVNRTVRVFSLVTPEHCHTSIECDACAMKAPDGICVFGRLRYTADQASHSIQPDSRPASETIMKTIEGWIVDGRCGWQLAIEAEVAT
jgi:hypothetical protein